MTQALQKMVEAMAAEMLRQRDDKATFTVSYSSGAPSKMTFADREPELIDLEKVARAGLEAIMEPGDDVISAGDDQDGPTYEETAPARAHWKAMLSEILKETP
jgi:hypothetical protein